LVKKETNLGSAGKSAGLTQAELDRRLAILRRFKVLMSQQRERFNSYLQVLEKQQGSIESGSADDLLAYVEIEEKIVADIVSIQRVIEPLDEMYRSVASAGGFPKSQDDVPKLKAALEDLKNEAIVRTNKNKELLASRITELRMEIKSLANSPFTSKSSGTSGGISASIIDIQG